MIISDLDHDVAPLELSDFADENTDTVRYIIAQVELNRTASNLYFSHCSPTRLPLSRAAVNRLHAVKEVQDALEVWYDATVMPGTNKTYNCLALILKVCYQ
jgi:hypothetical protein